MTAVKMVCSAETINLTTGKYFYQYNREYLYMIDLKDKGWRFYVVDQSRGWCKSRDKIIAIPLWCVQKAINEQGRRRLVQYILHEIAHALDFLAGNKNLGHGESFMKILINICPAELLVYEMTYKPRNLVAAGAIFCPDSLNF